MPCVGSGIYSSGTGGQPFNSRECTIKTRALKYVYSVSDPECFGGRLVTLVEYTECQVEDAERYRWPDWFYQQPSCGIAPDFERLGNRSLTLRECTVGYVTDDLF